MVSKMVFIGAIAFSAPARAILFDLNDRNLAIILHLARDLVGLVQRPLLGTDFQLPHLLASSLSTNSRNAGLHRIDHQHVQLLLKSSHLPRRFCFIIL